MPQKLTDYMNCYYCRAHSRSMAPRRFIVGRTGIITVLLPDRGGRERKRARKRIGTSVPPYRVLVGKKKIFFYFFSDD